MMHHSWKSVKRADSINDNKSTTKLLTETKNCARTEPNYAKSVESGQFGRFFGIASICRSLQPNVD